MDSKKETPSGPEDFSKSVKRTLNKGVKFNPDVIETSITLSLDVLGGGKSDPRPRRYTFDSSVTQTPDFYQPVSNNQHRKRAGSVEILVGPDEENCGITVGVRVRPLTTRELCSQDVRCIIEMVNNETIVKTDKSDEVRFAYDYSFWSCDKMDSHYASQEYVYESFAQPLLTKAFDGYNTCLFAYGQTGSGKSYSITGDTNDPGIIPRFCEELFARIRSTDNVEFSVDVSFYEIYKEKIRDLLTAGENAKDGKIANLKVREHPTLGPYVEGLTSYAVKSYDDIKRWLNLGNSHRVTAATCMNDRSSRSHSVFTALLTQTKVERIDGAAVGSSMNSRINIVDLAGSERQSLAKTSGDRLREGASINRSLLTLGKVISMLAELSNSNMPGIKRKKVFIPYRDSVLTWLLKESLGGNSKTAMLATISPANTNIEETLSTLRYAKQARSIMNNAKVNDDPKARLIRELRREIEKLKQQPGTDDVEANNALVAQLKHKLIDKEREMEEAAKLWEEKLKQIEKKKEEEAKLLEKEQLRQKHQMELQNQEAAQRMQKLTEEKQMLEVEILASKKRQELSAEATAACATPRFLDFPLLRQLEQARDEMKGRVQHLQLSAKRNRMANNIGEQSTPTCILNSNSSAARSTQSALEVGRELLSVVAERGCCANTSLFGEVIECCVQINLLTKSICNSVPCRKNNDTNTPIIRLLERACRLVTLVEMSHCLRGGDSGSVDVHTSSVIGGLTSKLMNLCSAIITCIKTFFETNEREDEIELSLCLSSLQEKLFRICSLSGAISLATDAALCKLDTTLKEHQNVMMGCGHYLSKVLNGGLSSLTDSKKRLLNFDGENVVQMANYSQLLNYSEKLICHCQSLLEALIKYQACAFKHSNPSAVLNISYSQCHQIITCVSDLVENIALLIQAVGSLTKGDKHGSSGRVNQCLTLCQKSLTKLMNEEIIERETGAEIISVCWTTWEAIQIMMNSLNLRNNSPKKLENSPFSKIDISVSSPRERNKCPKRRLCLVTDFVESP